MNRRGFISLLVGPAGAALVPWRGSIEPLISLPPRQKLFGWPNGHYSYSNYAHPTALTQECLEDMMRQLSKPFRIVPTHLIVSPEIKHLIDTDPVVRHAAELALGRRL